MRSDGTECATSEAFVRHHGRVRRRAVWFCRSPRHPGGWERLGGKFPPLLVVLRQAGAVIDVGGDEFRREWFCVTRSPVGWRVDDTWCATRKVRDRRILERGAVVEPDPPALTAPGGGRSRRSRS
jgi:hypothetical protein